MKNWIFLMAAVGMMTACTPTAMEKLPYHKLTVYQGMPLDAQAIAAIKPGMTRQQVVMEIGQPMLSPSFRNDRWDYVYEVTRGGLAQETRTLTVFFDQNNTVSHLEGSALNLSEEQTAE